jgi:hypothetical protein
VISPAANGGTAEEQVERDRRPDELRQVGGDRDRLGLHPQPPGDRPREALAAQLRQVAARRDARLGRQVLDEHRHQVRGEDHPDEQVAVLGAAGDVRGEVAGVDVRHGGHERRPQQRQAPAQPPARPDAAQRGLLERRMPREMGRRLGDGGRRHATSQRGDNP